MSAHLFAEGHAVAAHYHIPAVAEHRGNPFIEALPPTLSREAARAAMAWLPEYDDASRRAADIDREHMPTGYCLDCDLWYEFHDQFKRTGDAKYSFDQALEAAICAINRDIEYQFSDEAVDESLIANEYRFTNEGKFFN